MFQNSLIVQISQVFAVQFSVPIFVKFLEKLEDISARLLEVKIGAS